MKTNKILKLITIFLIGFILFNINVKAGTLKNSNVCNYEHELTGGPENYFFGGNKIERSDVISLTFVNTNTVPSGVDGKWDASVEGDKSVMVWYYRVPRDEYYDYNVYVGANGMINLPSNSSCLFAHFTNRIYGLYNLNTSNVTSMEGLFAYSWLNGGNELSGFSTSNVSNMAGMFKGTQFVSNTIDVSHFNTSNVTNMEEMFAGFDGRTATDLTTLDLSTLDMSNVTNVSNMFARQINLASLNLNNFNTSNAIVTGIFGDPSSSESRLGKLKTLTMNNSNVGNLATSGEMAYILKNLTTLEMSNAHLTAIDLSNSSKLTDLNLSGNNISTLNLNKSTYLKNLDVSNNNLDSLSLTKNTKLETLKANNNSLTSVDITKNTKLTELKLDHNNLTTVDTSANTKLTEINLSNNNLSNVGLSTNTLITKLNLSNNNLSSLDISANPALTELDISNNHIESTSLSNNNALVTVNASNNSLASFTLGNNTVLTTLDLSNNQLRNLSLTNNTALTTLNLSHNNLRGVDFSNNTALTTLDVSYNSFGKVNVSNNTALTSLSVDHNSFTGDHPIAVGGTYDFPSESNEYVVLPNDAKASRTNIELLNDDTVNKIKTYRLTFDHHIGSDSTYSVIYNICETSISSTKYDINYEDKYIYTKGDTDKATILSNITATNVDLDVVNNQLTVSVNNQVTETFDIITPYSTDYDLSQNVLIVSDANIESFLSKIGCINCEATVFDTMHHSSGDFKENSRLMIMQGDTMFEDYPLVFKVLGVSLPETLTIHKTETPFYQLTPTFTPAIATNRNVDWRVGDVSILTVDNNGLLRAHAPGTTTVTVYTEDGDYSATMTVTIINTYKVTYDDNGTTYEEYYEPGQTITFKTDLQRAGYTLVGYSYNDTEYSLTDVLQMPSEDIVLTPLWEIIIPTISSSSGFTLINGGYLKRMPPSIQISEVNLMLDNIYSTRILNKDDQEKTSGLLATGDKIQIYLGTTKVVEYPLAIIGDTTGDGEIKYSDVVKVFQHRKKAKNPELINVSLLENEYFIAGDMSGEGEITYSDAVIVFQKVKELKGGNN